MLKFADQSRDLGGQDTHKILTVFAAPDYVKKASIEQTCGDPGLPAGGFADRVNKLYPCHTPAATWLSTAFFLHKRAELQNAAHVEQVLEQSASYHGIAGDIAKLKEEFTKFSQHAEAGLQDEDFALVIEYDGGRRERRYPMRNALETKTAAEYLAKHRREFSYADRQKIAEKILLKAAEFGSDIRQHREMLEKTAGRGIGSLQDTADMLTTRALLIRTRQDGEEPAAEIAKMAAVIVQHPEQFRSFDKLAELAAAVDEIDRHYQFTLRYGQGVLDFPEDTIFELTHKVAADLSQELVSTTVGSIYKIADLMAVPLDSYRESLGSEFADSVSVAGAYLDQAKLAEVVPTLPRPDAERLDMLMAQSNTALFGKQAAAGYSKLQDPAAKAAAAAYKPPAQPGSLWAKYRQPAAV